MEYSPKLKVAMEAIKKVLKEHDVAAMVVLHAPGFTEYLLEIETSYSCAKLEGGNTRVNNTQFPKHKKKEVITNTSNMLNGLAMTTMKMGMNLANVSEYVDKQTGTEHTDLGHTPGDAIKN